MKSYSEACSELNHVSDFFTAQGESNLADELCKIISKAQSLYVKKRLANAVQKNITDFFNAKWINNKELSLNTLLYVSVRYTCYCSIMLLFGNCIIVCHICRLGQFWLKEHLIPSMEPLKWRNIHDLYTTDTSLIRTLCSVPSVSVLERFDCSCILYRTNLMSFQPKMV